MNNTAETVAKALLGIGAVFLRPNDPFRWASGIRSPIYCDNRLILSHPAVRTSVEKALCKLITAHYPSAELLAGTSTAGIAHAAIAAEMMGLPMAYVRGSSKDHGRENRIEGHIPSGAKVVVIEDLISTAGSAVDVAEVIRESGAEVLGIASIFTYEMQKGLDRLAAANLRNVSLSNYTALVKVAAETGVIEERDIARLAAFQQNPSDDGWMKSGACPA